MTLQEVLRRLRGVEELTGGQYEAWCPAHPDERPDGRKSLAIRMGTKNPDAIMLDCRTRKCSLADIAGEIGLTRRDLFVSRGNSAGQRSDIVATYDYTTAKGTLLFQVCRKEMPPKEPGGKPRKRFLQRRPALPEDIERYEQWKAAGGKASGQRKPPGVSLDGRSPTGHWCWTSKDIPKKPLYRLPAIIDAVARGKRIYVVEGEKCVQTLEAIGRIATTCPEGSKKWQSQHAEPLAGARVVVLPDADGPGRRHAQSVARSLASVGAEIRVVDLPGLGPKDDIVEWLDVDGNTPEQLDRIVGEAPVWTGAEDALEDDADAHRPLPTITVRAGELPAIVDDAEVALSDGSSRLYHRGGELVCIQQDEETRMPVLRGVKRHQLRGLMAKSARWIRLASDGNGGFREQSIDPPMPVVDVLRERRDWSCIEPCIGVVESPTLRSDFSVLDSPGYDAHSMLLFDPGKLTWPRVDPRPSREDAEVALKLLKEVIIDFPFRSHADRSVALALFLTSVVRPALPTAPLFIVTGHTRGTGKSQLCRAAHMTATGHDWQPRVATDDQELRKSLFSAAMEGARFFCLDNLAKRLASPVLDAALTTPFMSDRVLGASQLAKVRLQMTLMATGNNLTVGGDLGRRVLRSYLDTEFERPEERTGFLHPDLLHWIQKHRPRLAHAILTIVRACYVAEPDIKRRPMGSFEAWDHIVRRPLLWLGEADPLDTQVSVREEDDVEEQAWVSFLLAWREMFHNLPNTTKRLLSRISQAEGGSWEEGALASLETLLAGKVTARKVGALLKQQRDRKLAGLVLRQESRSKAGMLWRVAIVDPAAYRKTRDLVQEIESGVTGGAQLQAQTSTTPNGNGGYRDQRLW